MTSIVYTNCINWLQFNFKLKFNFKFNFNLLILILIFIILAACALPAVAQAIKPQNLDHAHPAEMPLNRQKQLLHLLKQDCGACHGLTMQGGLGLPLTPKALENKPDVSLVATILQGRNGTAMPAWQPFISEQEAFWLVQRLRLADWQ